MISHPVRLHTPCGRMECGPGWTREPEHSALLTDAELWFVWRGRGWMRTADRTLDLLPGFCALMRPGGVYDAGHDDERPLGIVFVHFDVRRARPSEVYAGWPEFWELSDVPYWDALTRRIVQLWTREPETAALLLQAALADLLGTPSLDDAWAGGPPGLLERRVAEMAARIPVEAGPPPTVASLAAELGVSPEHFSRTFRKVIGESPRDFLVRNRIMRARYFLRETALTVTEIADRLGYADVYFFSRQFRQKTGRSPLHYRRRRT